VDEAIARAERFLDESLLTDQRTVRLIHGYGTGQLKRALSGFLLLSVLILPETNMALLVTALAQAMVPVVVAAVFLMDKANTPV